MPLSTTGSENISRVYCTWDSLWPVVIWALLSIAYVQLSTIGLKVAPYRTEGTFKMCLHLSMDWHAFSVLGSWTGFDQDLSFCFWLSISLVCSIWKDMIPFSPNRPSPLSTWVSKLFWHSRSLLIFHFHVVFFPTLQLWNIHLGQSECVCCLQGMDLWRECSGGK